MDRRTVRENQPEKIGIAAGATQGFDTFEGSKNEQQPTSH